jgi:Ni,Fe-hydrogenase I large subunit
MSHITHFYHLAALDYVDMTNALGPAANDMSPWIPQHLNPTGMVPPGVVAGTVPFTYDLRNQLVANYVAALGIRREAHTLAAEIGGKHPCQNAQVPGGITSQPSKIDWANVISLLDRIRAFIATVYLPDLVTVALAFGSFPPLLGLTPNGFTQGFGCGNTLSWGAFPNPYDLGAAPFDVLGMPLFAPGTCTCPGGLGTAVAYATGPNAQAMALNVTEDVLYSHYTSPTGLHPSVGVTTPGKKAGPPASYTWHKNPRYNNNPHEVGPMPRMLATALAPAPYVAPTVNDADIPTLGGVGAPTYNAFVPAGYPLLTGGVVECASNSGSADHLGLTPGPIMPLGNYTAGGLVLGVLNTLIPFLGAVPAGVVANPLSALFSTLGRHAARGLETKYMADAMGSQAVALGAPPWPTGQLGTTPGIAGMSAGLPMVNAVRIDPVADGSADVYRYQVMPNSLKAGAGLTEAPRGALGHWVTTERRRIVNYQCVVPSTWNCCGKDDAGVQGPIEQSLMGANVGDPSVVAGDVVVNNLLKTIHPFDICIACSVHVVDSKGKSLLKFKMDTDGKVTKDKS